MTSSAVMTPKINNRISLPTVFALIVVVCIRCFPLGIFSDVTEFYRISSLL